MKFKKIAISSEGGHLGDFTQYATHSKNKLELVTYCDGEILKWNDPMEVDAINLVIKWEFAVKNKDTIKIFDKSRKQHYRIHEKEIPPKDEQIIDVIKETYSDFEIYFEKEEIDKNLTLSPLNSSLIEETLDGLKKLFEHLPQQ